MEVATALSEEEDEEESPSCLISNVEVLELLTKNAAQQQQLSQHAHSNNKKRWRQRDWLERQVIEYLQSTPCTKLDPTRRREFQSILQGRKNKQKAATVAKRSNKADAAAAASNETQTEVQVGATTTTTSPKKKRKAPPSDGTPTAAAAAPEAPYVPDETTSSSTTATALLSNGGGAAGVALDCHYSNDQVVVEAKPDRTESSSSQQELKASASAATELEQPQHSKASASRSTKAETSSAVLSMSGGNGGIGFGIGGFGLTEAEALQILNFMPTEAVELHLMVEDLNARLTQKQQDGLLESISKYTTTIATTTTTTSMTTTNGKEEGDDNDKLDTDMVDLEGEKEEEHMECEVAVEESNDSGVAAAANTTRIKKEDTGSHGMNGH